MEDQVHKQNNKLEKVVRGTLEILDNHMSMLTWMAEGLKISGLLNLVEVDGDKDDDAPYHEDNDAYEKRLRTQI